MILTIDLGSSVTKVALWEPHGLVAIARSRLQTNHGEAGRVEQDPAHWWESVCSACREAVSRALAAGVPVGSGSLDAIAFSAARQTFVPVGPAGDPLGAGILWSDRRARDEAADLVRDCGGQEELRRRTGIYLESGSVVAKLAWIARHEPERLGAARWILSPRDLILRQMTGHVLTDPTLSSASGLYDDRGELHDDLVSRALSYRAESYKAGSYRAESKQSGRERPRPDIFPEVQPSSSVAGGLLDTAARQLGLTAGTPVVVGAGDRACEVLGSGASQRRPMVSWGTTANVSVPSPSRPEPIPGGMIVTKAAGPGWLLEGGLAGAGSLVEWIARTTHVGVKQLMAGARERPPGARGLTATPWLGGARAPWWRPDASAAVVGLDAVHDGADLTRAAVEGVAFDLARCLEAAYGESPGPSGLALAGAGSTQPLWAEVVTAVTGLVALTRRSGEAASAGAAMLAALAVGIELDLEELDPVVLEVTPAEPDIEAYEAIREVADEVAASLLEIHGRPAR